MFTKEDFKTEFNKSIEFLKDKLAKIHSGRANSSIVEDIKVNYQNFDMPLKQLASISLQGAKTLIIEPWDKGAIQAVERSLLQANLHATPNTEGQKIWLIFPSLTKELKIDTEGYKRLMKILEVVKNDTWQLFEDMNHYNKHAKQTRENFIKSINEINRRLEK